MSSSGEMSNRIIQPESVELISMRNLDDGETTDEKSNNAVALASEDLREMVKIIETKLEEGEFDQKTNLREMVKYLKNLAGSQTKTDVEKFLDLSPKKEGIVGSGVIVLATLDSVLFDVLGAKHFYTHGHSYLFILSVCFIVISVIAGFIRFTFIGKEIYNLKKAITIGYKPQLIKTYPNYYHEWLILPWKAVLRYITQFCENGFYKISMFRTHFSSNGIQRDEVVIEILKILMTRQESGNAWHMPRNAIKTEENIGCEPKKIDVIPRTSTALGYPPEEHSVVIPEADGDPVIFQIQSLPNVLYNWLFFFAPSIPLHYLVIQHTRELDEIVKNVDHWTRKEGVIGIYVRLAYLNLVKFEGAEMSLTELFAESIPQVTLRTVPFVHGFIQQGILAFFSQIELYEMTLEVLLFVNSFFAPSIPLVLGTLTKMGYYFQVYKEGDKFVIEKEGLEIKSGVKLFEDFYKIPHKILSVTGHFLTMGPMIFIAVTSCCSSLGPLPFFILLGSFSITFWRPSHIPLYNIYYTWACTLSTLNFSKTEFSFGITLYSLGRKILAFFVAIVFTFTILHMDYKTITWKNTENILGMLFATFLLYSFGSLLLLVDRLWLRDRMGQSNFNLYINKVTESQV